MIIIRMNMPSTSTSSTWLKAGTVSTYISAVARAPSTSHTLPFSSREDTNYKNRPIIRQLPQLYPQSFIALYALLLPPPSQLPFFGRGSLQPKRCPLSLVMFVIGDWHRKHRSGVASSTLNLRRRRATHRPFGSESHNRKKNIHGNISIITNRET